MPRQSALPANPESSRRGATRHRSPAARNCRQDARAPMRFVEVRRFELPILRSQTGCDTTSLHLEKSRGSPGNRTLITGLRDQCITVMLATRSGHMELNLENARPTARTRRTKKRPANARKQCHPLESNQNLPGFSRARRPTTQEWRFARVPLLELRLLTLHRRRSTIQFSESPRLHRVFCARCELSLGSRRFTCEAVSVQFRRKESDLHSEIQNLASYR